MRLSDAIRSTVDRVAASRAQQRRLPPSAGSKLKIPRHRPRPFDQVTDDFLEDGLRAYGYITGGARGEVFAARLEAAEAGAGPQQEVAVKIVDRTGSAPDDFAREVHAQRRMRAALSASGDLRVPDILDAWTVNVRGRSFGVLVMERVACTVHEMLFYHHADPRLMRSIVGTLKGVVERLQHASAVHGDLHTGNVGFDEQGRVFLMDHEFSLCDDRPPPGVEEPVASLFAGVDVLCMWRHSLVPGSTYTSLNIGLLENDFPGSELLEAAFGEARPMSGGSDIGVHDIDQRVLFDALRRIRGVQRRTLRFPPPLRDLRDLRR
jgi:hypothetical protein